MEKIKGIIKTIKDIEQEDHLVIYLPILSLFNIAAAFSINSKISSIALGVVAGYSIKGTVDRVSRLYKNKKIILKNKIRYDLS